MIEGIAFQTNILALSAVVEAASVQANIVNVAMNVMGIVRKSGVRISRISARPGA
ncbi:hypothetical protein OKW49_008278 [Paraburkholderia youngii]|uniref:hypothetical protein n=1 Tax=Paraburkholderia youngii TaxID=2782701 RepID=UPI003D22D6BF